MTRLVDYLDWTVDRPLARATGLAGWGLNIEFEHGFGGKLRWLIRLQTGI